jgi:nucleoside-diphosphate-sugar epimerase
VLASSCAVYGDRSGLWVSEDYPPSPGTAYGRAKVAAEAAWLAAGMPAQVARLAAVYGPGCRFTMAEAIRAGRAWLPGEGRNFVPVIHVEDCARALLAVADRGAAGSIVHVAGQTQPSLAQFYAAVHRQVGGTPVRFWSTWIPSVVQDGIARRNERVQAWMGRQPRLTPDALRLATAGVRLRVDRLGTELGFSWSYGDHEDGLRHAFPTA